MRRRYIRDSKVFSPRRAGWAMFVIALAMVPVHFLPAVSWEASDMLGKCAAIPLGVGFAMAILDLDPKDRLLPFCLTFGAFVLNTMMVKC